MERQTSKLQAYSSLFSPSASGVVMYVALAGLAIVLKQFEAIEKYLQLPKNLDIVQSIATWADNLLTRVIGQSTTETLVVGLFWAIVGLIVYMFLRGLARVAVELDDNLGARNYVWPKGTDRTAPLRHLAEQVAFRVGALVGLVVIILGPLAAVIRGPVFVDFLGPNKILQYVVWFVAGVIVWHLLVVALRMIALRARLFG